MAGRDQARNGFRNVHTIAAVFAAVGYLRYHMELGLPLASGCSRRTTKQNYSRKPL
jgi:hypothetical protein